MGAENLDRGLVSLFVSFWSHGVVWIHNHLLHQRQHHSLRVRLL